MTEDLTALKDKIIISQQKQIRALQAECHQLRQDNAELNVILTIALQDGKPIVVSRERYAETIPAFVLEQNFDGGLIIKRGRKDT